MKISRLYIKIYVYFLVVILIICILIPVIFFFLVDKPYKNYSEKRIILFTSIIKTLLVNNDLKSAINDIAKETNSDLAIYDENGKVITSSSNQPEDLSDKVIKKVKKCGNYSEVDRKKNKAFFLMSVNKSPYSYISISADTGSEIKERRNRFFLWLIIFCFLLALLIYPLAMNITKPLEHITEKAMKFSQGNFNGFTKDNEKKKPGDEITKLDNAFNHMAGELIAMIEAKKELLSDISHELGSPLSRMKVALEIIQDKVESNKLPSMENLNGLSDDIDVMAKLVKELLEFSKMDLKGYSLDIKPANPEDIIYSSVKSFENLAGKHNLTIEVKKEGDLQELPVDSEKISRVMQNLLSNAIKYSPENGKIKILLKGEKEHFSVSVTDEGPGIGKENGEKIFQVFFREDPSRTRDTGGTGLGLAIAKKIIDLHRGTIWVDNPGKPGATIIFRI